MQINETQDIPEESENQNELHKLHNLTMTSSQTTSTEQEVNMMLWMQADKQATLALPSGQEILEESEPKAMAVKVHRLPNRYVNYINI